MNPSQTEISAPIFPPIKSAQNHSSREKTKKAAANLVQSSLNPFIISIFSENSRRKNAQKRPKNDLFRPFSALFQPFSASFLPSVFVLSSPFYAPRFCVASGDVSHPRWQAGVKIKNRTLRANLQLCPLHVNRANRPPVLPTLNRLSRGSALNFVASPLFFSHSQRTQVCR
jgi:hypothetical protein